MNVKTEDSGEASPFASKQPDVLVMINGELSSRSRWFYRVTLVAAGIGLAALLSLWLTEPGPLPLRLHVAFAALAAILSGWCGVFTWILLRRNCPTENDRIASSWMAVAACSLFLIVSVSIAMTRGGFLAALTVGGVGIASLIAAAVLLRSSYHRRARLKNKLGELEAATRHSRSSVVVMFALLCLVTNGRPCSAQATIDTESQVILNAHVEACGGNQKLAELRSKRIVGSLVKNGNSIRIEILKARPNRMLSKTFFPRPGTLIQGFDGTSGWIEHPSRGSLPLDPSQKNAMASEAWMDPILFADKIFDSVQHIGYDSKLKQHKLLLKRPDGTSVEWFFDGTSGRLSAIHQSIDLGPRGVAKIETQLEDYRETDGIHHPWTVRTITPRDETVLKVEKIEHNVEVSDEDFRPSN